MEVDDKSMDFLNKKTSNRDGIFRLNPKEAKDKQKGAVATVRFLPNVLEDMTLGPSAIENYIHYANLPDYEELRGFYHSQKSFESNNKCPLGTFYWKLYNSKNQAEKERAELIKGSPKYYSYVLIIEDEQHEENEGKIMVFPYGIKIRDKINLEREGENSSGKKCNVFDPANGKDFRLICKEVGGYQNYDSSSFKESSPIKIYDEDKKKFIQIPVTWDENKQKNVIDNPKVQTKLFEFLRKKDESVNIEKHAPKRWTDEERAKVEKIIAILSGKDVSFAKAKINQNTTSTRTTDKIEDTNLDNESDDLDDFFGDVDDDK
jgi:hypothetical protein